jgi:molybdopterin synthase sulfur carrier subunit
MQIKVLAFGVARDILGDRSMELEVPDNCTVRYLKQHLIALHPAFIDLSSLKFAVNNEYVLEDRSIHEEDEIALIPPVSGG